MGAGALLSELKGSLRWRLIGATVSATALILAICGVVIYSVVRARLIEDVDGTMLVQARAVSSMVETRGDAVRFEFDEQQLPEFRKHDYFQCWSTNGTTIVRSPSLSNKDLPRLAPSAQSPTRSNIRLPDGKAGRAVGIWFVPRPEDEGEERSAAPASPMLMVVARRTEKLDDTLETIAGLLVGVCGVAIVLSAGVMAWLIGRGMRPVDRLAARIAGIDGESLSERVEMGDAPKELTGVVQRLNELLGRLQAAFAREKAFASDVAHELRTPLAGLQAAMEVGTSRARSAEEYQQIVTRCLRATRQMHAMVDNLLVLARAESSQLGLTSQTLAIKPLLEECWAMFADRAAERGLHLSWRVEENCELSADREKLRLVLHNLFDNAVCHADPNGGVTIEAAASEGRFRLEVSNSGSQISQAEASHVFERFWRGDASRAETGAHCGLGLTLVKRLVEAMGGSASVTSEVGGLFRIVLAFPLDTERTLQSVER